MSGQGIIGDAEARHQMVTKQGADDLGEVGGHPLIDGIQAYKAYRDYKPKFVSLRYFQDLISGFI